MKKHYIKPQTDLLQMEVATPIAASLNSNKCVYVLKGEEYASGTKPLTGPIETLNADDTESGTLAKGNLWDDTSAWDVL